MMTDGERNIEHFRRFQLEVIVDGNFENIDAYMAPTMRVHRTANTSLYRLEGRAVDDGPKEMSREAFRKGRDAAVAGRSQHRRRIIEAHAAGDRVFARWTIEWVHDQDYAGVPATGRQIVVEEAGIMRFNAEGQIIEGWYVCDHLDMFAQMGARLTIEPGV